MITDEEVEHIGLLARIKIDDAEKKSYAEKLNSVLDYFAKLDEIDTDVEPTYHVFGHTNVLRDDVVVPSLPQAEILKNAPATKGDYIKAPRIV